MESRMVLVVDDDLTVSEMLKTGLELYGYNVGSVANEAEFWAAVNQKTPDIILMDVGIPGQDGISLCRNVRLSPSTKDIPIIVVTAFSDDKTFHDAMMFGANDFLSKPFEMEEVREKIEKAIVKFKSKAI